MVAWPFPRASDTRDPAGVKRNNGCSVGMVRPAASPTAPPCTDHWSSEHRGAVKEAVPGGSLGAELECLGSGCLDKGGSCLPSAGGLSLGRLLEYGAQPSTIPTLTNQWWRAEPLCSGFTGVL